MSHSCHYEYNFVIRNKRGYSICTTERGEGRGNGIELWTFTLFHWDILGAIKSSIWQESYAKINYTAVINVATPNDKTDYQAITRENPTGWQIIPSLTPLWKYIASGVAKAGVRARSEIGKESVPLQPTESI